MATVFAGNYNPNEIIFVTVMGVEIREESYSWRKNKHPVRFTSSKWRDAMLGAVVRVKWYRCNNMAGYLRDRSLFIAWGGAEYFCCYIVEIT